MNTDQNDEDAISTDGEVSPGPISPFNMTGGFGSISPAPDLSPGGSDIDG